MYNIIQVIHLSSADNHYILEWYNTIQWKLICSAKQSKQVQERWERVLNIIITNKLIYIIWRSADKIEQGYILKRYDFSLAVKLSKDGAFWISDSNTFQSIGALYANALSS